MAAGRLARTVLVLAALGVVLSACGRRPGSLDTPYEAAVEARREAQRAGNPVPPEPQRPPRDRPFILDRLI